MTGRVLAVIGGQYGSEGKGVIVASIASSWDVHVRVGGPNAGHSFYDHEGEVWKMQSLPCGWINPDATLVIGPGAVVDLGQLTHEIEQVRIRRDPDIWNRVLIAANATVLDKRHHAVEGGVEGEIHQRIGSTGEGVGAARVARMNRDPRFCSKVADVFQDYGVPTYAVFNDVPYLLAQMREAGKNILLEGTQGSGLSLIHGPWPYVTSADTNAAQLLVDCGIPAHHLTDTLLVVRTHPIRVAGNSGPLKDEMSWADLSEKMGRATEERTTVTKKIRRVGAWDEELVRTAVILNAPTAIALTFADYLDPEVEGVTSWTGLTPKVRSFVQYLETMFDAPVAFIGTGGERWSVIDREIV